MATRTTYTSTIRVPIYASWKCPYCGETNFSLGNIFCQRQVTTSSLRRSKQEEAKNEASSRAQNEWQQNALDIIFNPQENPQNMRSDLFFQNTNCTKCGKKPKWDKGMGYMTILSLSLMPAIISGIVAIAMKTSWIAWLIFAAFFGAIVYCFVSEKTYKKTVKNMPTEYLPIIGSLNEALIAAAERQGKKFPSPDETIQLVGNTNAKNISESKVPVDSVETRVQNESIETGSMSNDKEQVCFCRKCGAKLPEGSDFCNKCGAAIVH